MLSACINLEYLYSLETLAMMEKTTRESSCLDNWVRRIAGVKRVDKRRIEELGEEIGVNESFWRKLVRSRLKWVLGTNEM